MTSAAGQSKVVVTSITLLRHGECEGEDLVRGRTDLPLNANGYQQMQAAAEFSSRSQNWSRVISSPLQRCKAFAYDLASRQNLMLSVMDEWQEFDYGDWEGRSWSQLRRFESAAVTAWFDDPVNSPPPNGETLEQLRQRVHKAWRQTLQECKGENVLVVTHGGVIKTLLGVVLDIPPVMHTALLVPVGSVTWLKVHHWEQHESVFLLAHNAGGVGTAGA